MFEIISIKNEIVTYRIFIAWKMYLENYKN